MTPRSPQFETRLARTEAEHHAALRLRYDVFVAELGGTGDGVDHHARIERDRFDDHAAQLLLIDHARPGTEQVVGVYRLMDRAAATSAGGFYTETEFDLGPLTGSGRALLELGRSCLHPDYRGGPGMYHLWQGLADLIRSRGIEVLFGTASFRGTDMQALAAPLTLLQGRHLAPPGLRVTSRQAARFDAIPEAELDRRQAMLQVPALIKAYLRLGGMVGDGVFVDHAFNTTDVCLVLDTAQMKDRQKAIYSGAIA